VKFSFHDLSTYCHYLHSNTILFQRLKSDHNEYFGPWELIDTQTFIELYQSTGIDVDSRLTYFKSRLENVEQSIHSLVSFAKSIPGFRSLSLDDQTTLIKCEYTTK
jgi:hypothetical protein